LGTFGRGFYVLDDYSSLREVGDGQMGKEAQIFDIRDAYVYEEALPLGLRGKAFQGDNYYTGENLGPTVLIDYYYPESFKSLKDKRRKDASKAAKDGKDNPYPTYEELVVEADETKEQLIFTIQNSQGEIVRKLHTTPSKGINRLRWDMRAASTSPINLSKPSFYNPFAGEDKGHLLPPGDYRVAMSKAYGDEIEILVSSVPFKLIPLDNKSIPTKDVLAKKAFQEEVAELSRKISGAGNMISEVSNKMKPIKVAIQRTSTNTDKLYAGYRNINKELKEIRQALYGDNIKSRLDIDQPPTPA